jgi:hypothetical protein
LQITGQNLPHAYTLAAGSRKERDTWVVALRKMCSANFPGEDAGGEVLKPVTAPELDPAAEPAVSPETESEPELEPAPEPEPAEEVDFGELLVGGGIAAPDEPPPARITPGLKAIETEAASGAASGAAQPTAPPAADADVALAQAPEWIESAPAPADGLMGTSPAPPTSGEEELAPEPAPSPRPYPEQAAANAEPGPPATSSAGKVVMLMTSTPKDQIQVTSSCLAFWRVIAIVLMRCLIFRAQEINQRKMKDVIEGNGITVEEVDGANEDFNHRRDELFEISGKPAVYPQTVRAARWRLRTIMISPVEVFSMAILSTTAIPAGFWHVQFIVKAGETVPLFVADWEAFEGLVRPVPLWHADVLHLPLDQP